MACYRGETFPTLPPDVAALDSTAQELYLAQQTPERLAEIDRAAVTRDVLSEQHLWYCAANDIGGPIGCDGECLAVLILTFLTFLIALYDAYNVQTCMKHLTAVRRHLVVMLLATGFYAVLNAMTRIFPAKGLLWGGLSGFLRIFYVYHYAIYLLSVVFIDGYGDEEELIEKAGWVVAQHAKIQTSLLQKVARASLAKVNGSARFSKESMESSASESIQHAPMSTSATGHSDSHLEVQMVSSALTGVPQSPAAASASLWIEKCLWKVRLWMLETVISYIAKSVCDEYLVYVAYEGRKKVLFQGALVYLALTDVLFAVICGVGIKQLVGTLRPLLHPKMQMLVKIRQFLFVFFYIFISMILRTLVGLIMAIVGAAGDDSASKWWTLHYPTFVASFMFAFQFGCHVAFVPPYSPSFGRTKLLEMKSMLRSRADVPAFLAELARRGIVLNVRLDDSQSKPELQKKHQTFKQMKADLAAAGRPSIVAAHPSDVKLHTPDEKAEAAKPWPQKPMIRTVQAASVPKPAPKPVPKPVPEPETDPLPEGWEEHVDEGTGKPYYANDDTGEVVWVRPKA